MLPKIAGGFSRNFLIFVWVALCSTFGLVIYFQVTAQPFDPSSLDATILATPRHIAYFELYDDENNLVNNKVLQGHWSFILFGFTHCSQICPATMTELQKMYGILQSRHTRKLPQVYLVTIDPKRDDQAALHRYVKSFHKSFAGVWGDVAQIDQLSRELGMAYIKVHSHSAENYDINHAGSIALFNPRGELVAFFTYPHTATVMAKEYQEIVANA